jgi:hypothetical protein
MVHVLFAHGHVEVWACLHLFVWKVRRFGMRAQVKMCVIHLRPSRWIYANLVSSSFHGMNFWEYEVIVYFLF